MYCFVGDYLSFYLSTLAIALSVHFGILKLFMGFYVPVYTKPEKENGSKLSSLVEFDPEDLKTLQ